MITIPFVLLTEYNLYSLFCRPTGLAAISVSTIEPEFSLILATILAPATFVPTNLSTSSNLGAEI